MKLFNRFLGLLLVTITIGMASCAKQDLEIGGPNIASPTKKTIPTSLQPDAGVSLIEFNATAFNLSSDLFKAVDFTIEDEIIMLTTSYSGGCGAAHFRLVADTQLQYSPNNTPIINAKLILDNDDRCSYTIKKTVAYDLTPIQQIGHSQVILKIADFGEAVYAY
jgi:hypothetical protein